jgi:glycosyltransferase involved in cell wall biosynthesis
MEEVIVPKISVIMPVYNCEAYVKEAIDSILNQTFSDFELIIIDDCSTDSTLSIVKSYGDPRINVVEKEQNTGYTNSLNSAILIAKGKYIARMDGDDISLPERFEKQLEFLEKNSDVILCGTGVEIIGKNQISQYPSNHEMIKIQLCYNASFYHPTIMIRKLVLLENNYNKEFEPAEDYELWTRLVHIGKLANLDEVLLQYRIHQSQTSNVRKQEQENYIFKCQIQMLDRLNISAFFTLHQIKKALNFSVDTSFEEVKTTLQIFDRLFKTNDKLKIFNKDLFEIYIKNKKKFYLRNYLFKSNGKWGANFFRLLRLISFQEIIEVMSPLKRIKKVVKKLI